MNVTEIPALDQAVLTVWELFHRSAYENPALYDPVGRGLVELWQDRCPPTEEESPTSSGQRPLKLPSLKKHNLSLKNTALRQKRPNLEPSLKNT